VPHGRASRGAKPHSNMHASQKTRTPAQPSTRHFCLPGNIQRQRMFHPFLQFNLRAELHDLRGGNQEIIGSAYRVASHKGVKALLP
jgi:hypothetical protein